MPVKKQNSTVFDTSLEFEFNKSDEKKIIKKINSNDN